MQYDFFSDKFFFFGKNVHDILDKNSMRFRQLITPTYKSLYDVCLNQAPFHQNDDVESRMKIFKIKIFFSIWNV